MMLCCCCCSSEWAESSDVCPVGDRGRGHNRKTVKIQESPDSVMWHNSTLYSSLGAEVHKSWCNNSTLISCWRTKLCCHFVFNHGWVGCRLGAGFEPLSLLLVRAVYFFSFFNLYFWHFCLLGRIMARATGQARHLDFSSHLLISFIRGNNWTLICWYFDKKIQQMFVRDFYEPECFNRLL